MDTIGRALNIGGNFGELIKTKRLKSDTYEKSVF